MNAGAMNPFSDPIMEAVFANKDVAGLAAQSLINAVLSEAGDPFIGEIVQLTPQKVASNPLGRGYRFDIEARARHEVADIEIQFRIIKMNERGMLYAVSILKDSAERGASLESVIEAMPRVIVINMLHFNLRPGHGDFCQPVDLAYRKPTADGSQERASDRMAIYNIEIKKFEKQVMPSLEKMPYSAETPALHYWLLALCKSQREKAPIEEVVAMSEALTEFARRDAGFSQYAERYEKISSDENVRRMYNIWTEGMSALDQARA
ncbi:MAG: PD-(D/E)XK nuclease family transposase, partial [Clostridiales bacterium]|nr:PD-(D/E)XK nuclease family transposase [Clostridiales bacterium]